MPMDDRDMSGAPVLQPSVCDFCGTADEANSPWAEPTHGACVSCTATPRDRALLNLLLALDPDSGVQNYSRLKATLTARDRRIVLLGRLFESKRLEAPHISYSLSLSQPQSFSSERQTLPLPNSVADYLIVERARLLTLDIDEYARLLTTGGYLIVLDGFRWPLPKLTETDAQGRKVPGQDILDAFAGVGIRAWFERPWLGARVAQRNAMLVGLKL